MTKLQLHGSRHGWVQTGLNAQANEWIICRADGQINFASWSWYRGPDGLDENGNRQIADGSHPAPGMVKNALGIAVGGWRMQGGSKAANLCPTKGPVFITHNDNQTHDNGGHWNVDIRRWRPDPQKVTKVIVRHNATSTDVVVEGKFRPLPKGFKAVTAKKSNRPDIPNSTLTFSVLGGVKIVPDGGFSNPKTYDFRYKQSYSGHIPKHTSFYYDTFQGPVKIQNSLILWQ